LTSGGTGRAAILLLRAAVVIVGDLIPERLAQARSFGCETIDLRERIPLGEGVGQILGVPEVDSAVDCITALALRPKVKPSRLAHNNQLR